VSPTPAQPVQTAPPVVPYTVADLQSALDAIGVDAWTESADNTYIANNDRRARTDALAQEAAGRLGAKVALIRPTAVGFPDEQTGSPNSVLWWVTTSEPTQLQYSYDHTVNGQPWSGWGQGDRDLGVLQARLQAFLAVNYPGQNWIVVTQTH
jgi:hypothetical protein